MMRIEYTIFRRWLERKWKKQVEKCTEKSSRKEYRLEKMSLEQNLKSAIILSALRNVKVCIN